MTHRCSTTAGIPNCARILFAIPLVLADLWGGVRAEETCWAGQNSTMVYCTQSGFDASHPAALSADRFLDDPDYRSDASYGFAGMEIVASTPTSVDTNAARFELLEHWIDLYQKPQSGGNGMRHLARLRLGPFSGPIQWDRTDVRPRAVFFRGTVGAFSVELRIHADSLLMLRVHAATDLSLFPWTDAFDPAYEVESGGQVMLCDGVGGVSLHPIGGLTAGGPFGVTRDDEAVYDPTLESWFVHLSAGQNVWVSVFPPKPFDWDIAKERIAWDYSGYPTESLIDGVLGTGFGSNDARNILLLQSEAIWEHWNLGFEPTGGGTELNRVVEQAEARDLRTVVYASPYYFTKNHPLPAVRDQEFTAPDAIYVPFGENSVDYIDAVRQLLEDYPDIEGIYLDEIYPLNLPESYALVLEVRRLLGPGRRLMYHNTLGTAVNPWDFDPWDAQFNLVHHPTTEAYADFLACGEEPGTHIEVRFEPNYLKYRVSGYNVSNSVGLLIYYLLAVDPTTTAWLPPLAPNLENGGDWLFESLAWDVLKLNGRLHYRTVLDDLSPPGYASFRDTFERYWPVEEQVTSEAGYTTFLESRDDTSQVFGHSTGGQHLVGDFDGNGRDDLAFFDPGAVVKKSYGHSSMYLRLSTAEGWVPDFGWKSEVEGPSDRIVFPAGGDFFVGDFDGNDLEDFAFFDPDINRMRIKLSAAPGFLDGPGWEGDWGHGGGDFYVGDFNADDRDDFAFFEPSDLSMHLRLNTEAGYVSTREWGWDDQPFGHELGVFYIGDFDGDGRDDFAFFEPGDNSMHVLLNTVTGYTFGTGWGAGEFGDASGEFAIGDFNGDQTDDFAFFKAGASFALLRSTVPGFEDRTLYFPGEADRILVGDFDGDGNDDLAWFEDPTAHLYYDRIHFSATEQPPRFVRGDCNGDGAIDISASLQQCSGEWLGRGNGDRLGLHRQRLCDGVFPQQRDGVGLRHDPL